VLQRGQALSTASLSPERATVRDDDGATTSKLREDLDAVKLVILPMRGGNVRVSSLHLLSGIEVGGAIVDSGGNCLAPRWRDLLSCGVAIRRAWREGVGFEAEGPNAYK
jgi:hypothetical protein